MLEELGSSKYLLFCFDLPIRCYQYLQCDNLCGMQVIHKNDIHVWNRFFREGWLRSFNNLADNVN